MTIYQLLVLLLDRQCVIESTDFATQVTIKSNKEVQMMETYSPDNTQPDLITYVSVEAVHESDANAMIHAIEETKERHLAPTELLADSLYVSDENVEIAKEMAVEVVAPAIGRRGEQAVHNNQHARSNDKKVRYDQLAAKRLQLTRQHKRTSEFKEPYRYRSGVEVTMSDLDCVTGIKHLCIREMIPVRVAVIIKATGLNFTGQLCS